jgi:hypothetical protein
MNANFKKMGLTLLFIFFCYLIQIKQTGVNNKDTDVQKS